MTALRAAVAADLTFLTRHPGPPGEEVIARQIRDGRLQIIEAEGLSIGLIKSYVLWETLPFMEVIILETEKRGLGHGARAVHLWEEEWTRKGFDLALVSTQSDETAHAFWLKIGYSDCGILTLRGKPGEIFMQRALVPQ